MPYNIAMLAVIAPVATNPRVIQVRSQQKRRGSVVEKRGICVDATLEFIAVSFRVT
jgi:hypothetical protein